MFSDLLTSLIAFLPPRAALWLFACVFLAIGIIGLTQGWTGVWPLASIAIGLILVGFSFLKRS